MKWYNRFMDWMEKRDNRKMIKFCEEEIQIAKERIAFLEKALVIYKERAKDV